MNSINKKLVVILSFSSLFVANTFARKNADGLRDLYAQLRNAQTKEPVGEKAKRESAAFKNPFVLNGKRFSTWDEKFETAANTNFEVGYDAIAEGKDLFFKGANLVLNALASPGNLQWTAFLQNEGLKLDEFGRSFYPGNQDYNNPILGALSSITMSTIKNREKTMTRYGFLQELFNRIDRIQETKVKLTIEKIANGLKQAIQDATK